MQLVLSNKYQGSIKLPIIRLTERTKMAVLSVTIYLLLLVWGFINTFVTLAVIGTYVQGKIDLTLILATILLYYSWTLNYSLLS